MTMHIALNHEQKLIHIDDAIRGLACECTCFCCHEQVIAKKGPTNEHHFAHVSLKESCQINPESILHVFAKEVILETKGMMMPALPDQEHTVATWWDFDEVQAEMKLGIIRPDIVAFCKEEPILIEMEVTHFVDDKKQAILNSLQLKTLEVDVSGLLKPDIRIPSEEAKQWILDNTDDKRWLFPQIPLKEEEKTVSSTVWDHHQSHEADDAIPAKIATAWQDYQFTIDGVYVRAREFSGGMLALSCIYNPALIAQFKKWRNEGGGRYNPQYKSWEYWQPFSKTVLGRLKQMHQTK